MKKPTLWSRNFTLITVGTFMSATGGAAMNVALGLVVFDNTASPWMTGLYQALSLLPAVILPVLLAPALDRYPRKRIVVGLDFLQGLLYLLFGAYVLARGFQYGAYLLFGVLTGAIGSVDSTAYSAFYPDLIPEGFLEKGYSVSSTIYPTVTLITAPLAALVYTRFGMPVLFFAEGALLVAASALESFIRLRENHAQKPKRFRLKEYAGEIAEGFRYLKGEKGVRSLYGYMSVTNGASAGGKLMVLAYFQTVPGLGTALYALLISAETLGRMLGGLVHYFLKIPVKRRFRVAATVYVTYDILDALLLFLPYGGMLAARFLCGFLGINSATLRESAIQHHLPSHMRARVNSLLSVAILALVVVTQLAAGALGEILPYRLVAVGMAAVAMVAVYLLIFRNRRPIRDLMNVDF